MLRWLAEPYQAYGGFAADGIKRVLGNPPQIDPLVVLVREAVQNSWDARLDSTPVHFSLSHRTLSAQQRSAIRRDLFAGQSPPGTGIADALASGASLLIVSDRNTTGLSGPVRADLELEPGVEDRFVKLVFNVGEPTEAEKRGGSYGFGKTISFVVSRAGATVIRTRTHTGAKLQNRLIAVALGEQYSQKGRRFTGRHWWGNLTDNRIEPLTGTDAADASALLGLAPFATAQTGTDIAVVSPDYGGRTPAEALRLMADALAWYFWPKMVPLPGRNEPPMTFSVDLDGVPVEIPDPTTTHPLDAYIDALRVLRREEAGLGRERNTLTTVREIQIHKPKWHLGRLAINPVLPDTLPQRDPVEGFGSAPTGREVHHVALMRQPELVVDYVQGPWNPSTGVHWAAVFKVDELVDHIFRESEPPTHDLWNPELVHDKTDRRAVNVAPRRIHEELSALFEAKPAAPPATSVSAVAIADALGGLIAQVPGTGPSRTTRQPTGGGRSLGGSGDGGGGGSGGGGSGGRVRTASIVATGKRELHVGNEDNIETWIQFRVKRPTGTEVSLSVKALVATDEGAEEEPPAGTRSPWILGLEGPDGTLAEPATEYVIRGEDPDEWWVGIGSDPDVAVLVDITAKAT
jgi:uncharacterized membrane protein YgcG